MITTTYTLGIMLIMVAIFLVIEMIRQLVNTNDARWALMILVVSTALVIGLMFIVDEPTDKDVLNGRAHYVNVVHQYNGNEVVTYRIEWNKKDVSSK